MFNFSLCIGKIDNFPLENALLLAVLDSCQLMKGDGQCDDLCNNPEMKFDGGDCCQDTIDSTYCSDCFCYQDCSHHNHTLDHWYNTITDDSKPVISVMECYAMHSNLNETTADELDRVHLGNTCYAYMTGDGICDDDCNHPHHHFDGGDCCLSYMIEKYCIECFCFEDCTVNHWTYLVSF